MTELEVKITFTSEDETLLRAVVDCSQPSGNLSELNQIAALALAGQVLKRRIKNLRVGIVSSFHVCVNPCSDLNKSQAETYSAKIDRLLRGE